MPKSILSIFCLAVLIGGCSDTSARRTSDEAEDNTLVQVGDLCRFYQIAKKAPPEKFADLASVNGMAGNGYEAVRTGKVILRYGAMLTDTSDEPGQGTSDEVLAYQQQVPESGGKVLLLNRAVKTMTAEEFKAAKKAGKEPPAPTRSKSGVGAPRPTGGR
jgi:hypothetical protein